MDSELANRFLRYEPETGRLFWRERFPQDFTLASDRNKEHRCRNWNSKFAEKEAFTFEMPSKVRQGRINKKAYLAHRVIWLMIHGQWPDEIDHIDGNPSNNKIENLRSVTRQENTKNLKRRIKNKIPNVTYSKQRKRWRVHLGFNKKETYHICIGKAIKDAIQSRASLGYHQNHGRYND